MAANLVKKITEKPRCIWPGTDPLYVKYHDTEWGRPLHDDRKLFESLVLDGAQAGLSWITILRKRENYRKAFLKFDPNKIARFDQRKIESLMKDEGIVRNRLKIESAVTNARALLDLQEEISFARFLWGFVGGKPIVNRWRSQKQVPSSSKEAVQMSKELKRRGFTFVGPTICYAFMQATGLVDDHLAGCFRARR